MMTAEARQIATEYLGFAYGVARQVACGTVHKYDDDHLSAAHLALCEVASRIDPFATPEQTEKMIYAAVRNRVYDAIRTATREVELYDTTAMVLEAPRPVPPLEVLVERLEDAGEREIAGLVMVDGLSHDAAAKQLGMARRTLSRRVDAIRAKLVRLLDDAA